MRRERQLGEVPEWSKTGPIDQANYGYRAELHCLEKSAQRKGAHPTIKIDTDDFPVWRQYFEAHLGFVPVVMQAMLLNPTDKTREMTVPEQLPQWFDPSFQADPRWRQDPYEPKIAPRYRRSAPPGEDFESMTRKYGRPLGPFETAGDKYNPWGPPTVKKDERAVIETPESVMARYGLSQEQWDAIPDAP
jgi:hypothetical protein